MADTQLDRARKIIREAEAALGPLGLQRTDLLLDNMDDLPGSAEAKALVAEIDAEVPQGEVSTCQHGTPLSESCHTSPCFRDREVVNA